MTYEDFHSLCIRRRSIHYFDDRSIPKDDVLKLLELARLSPSVQNTQPWHFHVIMNEEMRANIMKSSLYGNFVTGAGAFIVVTCDTTAHTHRSQIIWHPRELEYSCMSAMTNILHGATAMGLGSCWVTLDYEKVHAILRLPKHLHVVGGVMIGYYRPGEEAEGAHERRPLQELYTLY